MVRVRVISGVRVRVSGCLSYSSMNSIRNEYRVRVKCPDYINSNGRKDSYNNSIPGHDT